MESRGNTKGKCNKNDVEKEEEERIESNKEVKHFKESGKKTTPTIGSIAKDIMKICRMVTMTRRY